MTAAITTKSRLFTALQTGGELRGIANQDLIFSSVQSVEREDGSGKSWNVAGYVPANDKDTLYVKNTLYVKTLD